jgi:acylphosphatase
MGRGCIAKHVVLSGRVQGVWFRQFTRQNACALGVNGWVRNRPDGTVEMWAEGSSQAVLALLARCQDGPPRAEVASISAKDVRPLGIGRFQII